MYNPQMKYIGTPQAKGHALVVQPSGVGNHDLKDLP